MKERDEDYEYWAKRKRDWQRELRKEEFASRLRVETNKTMLDLKATSGESGKEVKVSTEKHHERPKEEQVNSEQNKDDVQWDVWFPANKRS